MRLRSLAILLALPVASVSQAQIVAPFLSRAVEALRGDPRFPQLPQTIPTQPTGFPLPPVNRSGDLPQPEQVGPEQGGLEFIHGRIVSSGDTTKILDGVEFKNKGYHVWADEASTKKGSDIYTLKGNVIVIGADESIYGDEVTVNFNDNTYNAIDARSTIKPRLIRGQLRDNLYVRASKSNGSQRELFGEKTAVTTCSYPDPHYEILADKTDVRPGRRIIFRKVRLKLLGHTVVTLPFLSIPLDQRNYNNLPQVGQSQAEGYFIKNRYGIPIRGNDVLNTRLDYFTKLGTGLGGDYRYDARNIVGHFEAYSIVGHSDELSLVNQHRQNFGWAQLTLDNSFQKDNHLLSPGSTIWNSRAALQIPQGRSSTHLTYNRTSTDGVSANSLNQTIGLNDTRFWNKMFQTTLDVNNATAHTSFSGGQDVQRQQVDLRFMGLGDFNKFQARLDYIRSIPVGESANFFSSSDITPSFALLSDSRRMFGNGFDSKFPFRTELSVGEYGESNPLSSNRITRSNFLFDINNPRQKQGRLQINYQAGFRQGVYSDDTAQYTLRAATQVTYRFTPTTAFNLRYSYLRPYGYTPLQIDRTGRTHVVNGDVNFSPLRNLTFGAQTGYDFNIAEQGTQTPWQQVGLRGEYKLGNYFNARTLSTYDTTRHAFSSTRFDLVYVPGSTFISFGAKYDGLRNKWAALNLFVDGFQIGRLRTSTLLNYNGYLRRFEAAHFSFIYDLHCAEAVFQVISNPYGGYGAGNQIVFFIRLKALPFDTPFGSGRQGQPLGTGTGRDS